MINKIVEFLKQFQEPTHYKIVPVIISGDYVKYKYSLKFKWRSWSEPCGWQYDSIELLKHAVKSHFPKIELYF